MKYPLIHPSASIHSTAIIYDNVTIGEGVVIGPYCVIGGEPEHKAFFNTTPAFGVEIRKNARIFEMVTIHRGVKQNTIIGENTCVFQKSHCAHDVVLFDDVIVGGMVSLAGHTIAMKGANINGKACTVPFAVIGAYGFLGAASFLTRHLPPGQKYVGFPAKYVNNNDIGLQRAGLTFNDCYQLHLEEFEIITTGRHL